MELLLLTDRDRRIMKRFTIKHDKTKRSKKAKAGNIIIHCSDEQEAKLKQKYQEVGHETI